MRKKLVAALLCVAMILTLLAGCGSSASSSTAASGSVAGTYEGTGLGFGDDITVQVTIKDGRMNDIAVLKHDGEDRPYYNQSLAMLDEMLSAQSADVDIVSGAILTCEGLCDAVADALGKAAEK